MELRAIAARLRNALADPAGASLVEYAVIAAFLSIALMAALRFLTPGITQLFSNAANSF